MTFAPEPDDTAYDEAEAKQAAYDEAKQAIINTLLAGENVNFSIKEEWTLEELLENYLVIPEHKLQQYIDYSNEI